MIKKILLSAVGLAVAGAAPLVVFTASGYWKSIRGQTAAPAAAVAATDRPEAGQAQPPLPAVARPTKPSLEGSPVRDLGEVLRFDLTPEWIMRHWSRVSTGLAQLQLQGYRVPLVTGTAENDLAGSLTYYFNPHQQVQRITFRGTTGDARKLIALLTTRHQFTRRLTNDPALMVYETVRAGGTPGGALRVRSAGVVKADEPYRRFDVELVMERPEG